MSKQESACCDKTTCCVEPEAANKIKEAEAIKEMVKEKYGAIALSPTASGCCGTTGCGCSSPDYAVMADDYSKLEGYHPDADLGLGCGIPTEFAGLSEGQTVLDLGSGAGNDAFVVRRTVGERGRVIGVDMTPAMIERARVNSDKLGYNNVEFRLGDIEQLPVSSESVDVVVSNCVLNLVPDKAKAFSEVHRVLKPGGRFSISDIVLEGPPLPPTIQQAAEMYAGCISGAIGKEAYVNTVRAEGFQDIRIAKEKPVAIPDEILLSYISETELAQLKASGSQVVSITVTAEKVAA